jgi:universal stress protein A
MFKNILVPTDLTEKSKTALDIAVAMNPTHEEAITLLHVIEMIEGAEDEDFVGFYEKLRKRALRMIDNIAGPYESKGPRMNREIVIGKRVPEIIRFAHEHDIDLIILSSHRIENFDKGEGWATISYQVGILAPCPVMMVK